MLSVIVSIYNRSKLFKRGLWTLYNQSLKKSEYEIIVVDDMGTEDTFGIMKEYAGKMNMQYIRIDRRNYRIPVFGHTPALSNNVGFKHAKGDVVAICQPEILHETSNLEFMIEGANKNEFVHGTLYASDLNFVYALDRDVNNLWRNKHFNELVAIPGAAGDTALTHEAARQLYWFAAAVKKDFVFKIGGVDEEYLRGVYAEDDNFRERLILAGATPTRDIRIRSIHQSHADEFRGDKSSKDRTGSKWEEGARINRLRWANWLRDRTMVANEGENWGCPEIIKKEVLNCA